MVIGGMTAIGTGRDDVVDIRRIAIHRREGRCVIRTEFAKCALRSIPSEKLTPVSQSSEQLACEVFDEGVHFRRFVNGE